MLLDRLIVNYKYEERSFVGSGTTASFTKKREISGKLAWTIGLSYS